ncbi:MAG TPA: deoxyguanosinetriphosphate triphosphohydrolase [Acidobacteriota bacterium]|nr:deoxyguanosinetriphosphate triphosphohydrolase [Acidobacteriota bacterium]
MELAPYAVKNQDTAGRRFPEPPHPYRSEYERDRDRIIHCKAFRRLENKTQVFAPDFSDHFRNRLTHTIEVGQISRTVARQLGLNTDLCEVLALSHDIGHPPFGHEGEDVLDRLMRRYGSGFDHNLHALRIVDDFEEKYASFRGLNLTFEVREGIIKHSRDYDENDDLYIDISEYRIGERPPLEAQLIDLADEVAYNTADLDDGYDSGLLSLEEIRASSRLFDSEWKTVSRKYPNASEKLKVNETVRRIIDFLVTGLIHQTRRNLEASGIDTLEKVRAHPQRLFGFDDETAELNRELKHFLNQKLYNHEELKFARQEAQRQVEELFLYYMQLPSALPQSHAVRIGDLGAARVVCDYIAGMTDTYARLRHTRIHHYQ